MFIFPFVALGFPLGRWRFHPRTFLSNQVPGAHSPASLPNPVLTLPQGITGSPRLLESFSPKRSQELTSRAGLLGSAPLPSPRSWRVYPGGGGRSSNARPGGALVRAELRLRRPPACLPACLPDGTGPLSRCTACGSSAGPFRAGAHSRNSAGKSGLPHPTLWLLEPGVVWRQQELRSEWLCVRGRRRRTGHSHLTQLPPKPGRSAALPELAELWGFRGLNF